jgi:hypothetical protein
MRTTRHSLLALLVSIGAVAATACTDAQPTSGRTSPSGTDVRGGDEVDVPVESPSTTDATPSGNRRRITGLRLAPFSDCAEFLDHVKLEARERVGPYGLDPFGYPVTWRGDEMMAAEMSATDVAFDTASATVPAAAPAGRVSNEGGDGDQAAASGDASIAGTNTQEEGVDEPDIIKTDGDRIITVWENVLSYVDISGGAPVLTGTLTLPEGWGHQLFISGDRALLLTNGGQWGVPMPVEPMSVESSVAVDTVGPYGGGVGAIVTEIDLSDPAQLRIAATLRIEGQYLNARAIGDRVVLAVSSGPQWMPWLYPQTQAGEQRATEANQALVDDSTLADWVPQFELSIDGGATTTGDLLGCEHLDRPAEFSGFDVISVIGLDMAAGLTAGYDSSQATGVLASGQTVYASLDRFYVATTKWVAPDAVDDENGMAVWSEDYQTDLHAFAITPGAPLDYVASGSVDGTLLNSFSLDEHDGYLRVLATDGTPWNRAGESETRLTVLAEDGEQLVTVGQVGGLGRGEALYSARLIGDRGFAVTFRQIDPFYVLDLTDPADPRVTGELKIPGFSTYLHPVGEHRVLGVGRNATEEGVVTGLKLSLFDVSDPANPVEISTWTLDNAQTAAEYDHHAFQMIGSTAILPVESWNDGFSGAIVFDIGDAITEVGRISHVPADAEPTSDCRRLVEGDVPQESPLYWYSIDTYTRFQLCGADDAGGYGDWYCDQVVLEQTSSWFGVDVTAQLTELDPDVARIEMCYPSGPYQFAIQRSLVIDGTLWTMSPKALWAHDLATLEPLASVTIGA